MVVGTAEWLQTYLEIHNFPVSLQLVHNTASGQQVRRLRWFGDTLTITSECRCRVLAGSRNWSLVNDRYRSLTVRRDRSLAHCRRMQSPIMRIGKHRCCVSILLMMTSLSARLVHYLVFSSGWAWHFTSSPHCIQFVDGWTESPFRQRSTPERVKENFQATSF